ncbi:Neuronal acetylcholine receptor subunit alpha-10 [Halotydeus destructor]|nr:Neuronal acetylcholine receptor subunit alpha-10 [Halotydeus destructor]
MCKLNPLVLTLFVTCHVTLGQDELASHVRLRNDLLVVNKYDRHSRPVKDHQRQTNVSMTLFIRVFGLVDPKSGVFFVSGPLCLEWTDEHLTWSPERYGGLESVTFGPKEIWKPDITSPFSAFANERAWSRSPVKVASNGTVTLWENGANFKGVCRGDMRDFPFDTLACYIIWFSWTQTAKDINITGPSKNFRRMIYGPYKKNPEWRVSGRKFFPDTVNLTRDDWPNIQLKLWLTRRSSFYRYKIGLPYLTAAILGVASFLNMAGSIRRYFFALSSILILLLLQISLQNDIGTHALETPYVLRCIGFNMATLAVSLTFTTIVYLTINHLSDICPPLPRVLANHLSPVGLVGRIFCLSDRVCDDKTKDKADGISESGFEANPYLVEGSAAVGKEWAILAQLVDRFCFFVYILVTIIYHT